MRQNSLLLILPLVVLFAGSAGCEEAATGDQPGVAIENVEVLAFTAKWCPACQRDKPRIEQLRRQGLKITSIDADLQPELLKRYGVNLLPTYIVLEGGIEVRRTNDIYAIMR